MKKYLGKPIIIEFLDHAAEATSPVKCKVIGWCVEECDKFLVLCYWDLTEESDETRRTNMETFSIVRSTISKIRILR